MKIIAINKTTKNYVADLGMQGEYPYSSSVGRRTCFNGRVKDHWYSTEINPRGALRVDEDTQKWIEQVNPTVTIRLMVGRHGHFIETAMDGEGEEVPSMSGYHRRTVPWNHQGWQTKDKNLRAACELLLAKSSLELLEA